MQIRIGIENNFDGRSLAWALDYPGCFAYGADQAEALIRLPRALLKYEAWINVHTQQPWVQFDDFDLRVVDSFTAFSIDENYQPVPDGQGYEIGAWFLDDWRPLSELEIERGLLIFQWQREELLAGLSTLSTEILEKQRAGERWNILGIVKHIANAELWYLSRMALTSLTRKNLLPDPTARLEQTAAQVRTVFPKFIDTVKVIGIDGEFWSYRKILRRTLWHQRDHIDHIKSLVFNEID